MQPMTNSLGRLRDIIAHKLCHRCGSCAGICPTGVIRPGRDYYPEWEGREKSCTDCDLCVRVCPGIEFSFPGNAQRIFGRTPTAADTHGLFLKAYIGYATDTALREGATSGGLGTQIPLWMIGSGKARGAFAVVVDEACPWRPKAIIARTSEQLFAARLSKYPACPVNHLFADIKNETGPFVFTGLPCHIHSVRKIASLNRALGDKIALTVGLFCHSCLEHQAIRDIFEIYGIDEKTIDRVEYRGGKLPGYIRALTKRGEWVYLPYPHLGPDKYRPNAKECLTFFFKFYSPPRCRLCIDASAEYADITIGDPWYKGWEADEKLRQGYSLIIARTERGLRALEEAQAAGVIALEPFPADRISLSQVAMVRHKKMRAEHNITRRMRKGLPVPSYGFYPGASISDNKVVAHASVCAPSLAVRLRAALHCATYFAADRPRLGTPLFRFLLSRPGRYVVGALFFPRRVLQALWEKLKHRAGRQRYFMKNSGV
ncbi:MAG: Coenzyme F420 hydrogenase/dehydrogenase, beta subunit C-terminal domain [Candidatus Aureabacteria bacterium]|nr:Coenzyme F420 hydrogenase/dehydrogenase, beta subunit C-terminal domain [Candidatus Auribacterota bacterium]